MIFDHHDISKRQKGTNISNYYRNIKTHFPLVVKLRRGREARLSGCLTITILDWLALLQNRMKTYYINVGKAGKRKRGTFEWLLNKRTGLSSLRKFKFKFSVLCIFAGSPQKKIFSPKDIKNVVVEKHSN